MRTHLPLNALRAFEASARHLSFTRAGLELHVTQAAISHQVKSLEENLGVALFRRLPRGLALTDEGAALLPEIAEGFRRIGRGLDRFEAGQVREVLTVGVVGSLMVGWLLPRLEAFRVAHPFIDLRLLANNNRVDLAGEGLDCAIRFGDGAWHGTEAVHLFAAPFSAACAPAIAARLRRPEELAAETLLRSYRADEWARWFAAQELPCPPARGLVADSSLVLAEAAAQGAGVALLPLRLFARELREGRLARPFPAEVTLGAYWLTWLRSRPPGPALRAFQFWLLEQAAG